MEENNGLITGGLRLSNSHELWKVAVVVNLLC